MAKNKAVDSMGSIDNTEVEIRSANGQKTTMTIGEMRDATSTLAAELRNEREQNERRMQIRQCVATGGVLTENNLMLAASELRLLVLRNAGRIRKSHGIADKLGAVESLLIELMSMPEDDSQGKLGLDDPEDVDEELGLSRGRGRNRRAS